MNAVSRNTLEEAIGIQMAHLARSEGHRPGLPNTDQRAIEKVKQTRRERSANAKYYDETKSLIIRSIKRGTKTAPGIAKSNDLNINFVRSICRDLHGAGTLVKEVRTSPGGSRVYVWSIATP